MNFNSLSGIEPDVLTLILDIGFDFTKLGFQKNSVPMYIIETPLSIKKKIRDADEIGITTIADTMADHRELRFEIEEFLKEIFLIKAQINAAGSSVVIWEQLIFPRVFMQALSEALFIGFEVSSVYYFLANILPLYTTGLDSGIIIDWGFLHTSISAVWHSVYTFEGANIIVQLEQRLKTLLKEDNKEKADLVTSDLVAKVVPFALKVLTLPQYQKFFKDEESIEKMKAKKFPLTNLKEEYKELWISYYTMVSSMEVFFNHDPLSEDINLAWVLWDSLLKISIVNRIVVVQNIILSGGIWMIPGFKSRLIQEINYVIDQYDKYEELRKLKDLIKFEKWIYPPNCLVWIGASLLSCLNEEVNIFKLTSSEFKDEHSGVLPDRFGQCFLKCSRKTEIEESDNKDDDLSIFAKDNESKIPVTVNAEKSWTFPKKSWTSTQKSWTFPKNM